MKACSSRLIVTCLSLCAWCFAATAEARPPHNKEFWKHYEKQLSAHMDVKCNVCHEGEEKKNRNHYGNVLKEKFGEKNLKDPEKIKAAFLAAEKEKSAIEGKTFGDLINEGKLPSSK